MPVLAPLTTLASLTATWLAWDYAQSRAEAKHAMATLSQFVAEPVLRLLMRTDLRASLLPQRREITVMVADMASYTQLTAAASLEDTARLTQEFLEAITHPVLQAGGTLDRYTGDGLIAFWGAPLPLPDHPQRCIAAALQVLDSLQALNQRRHARGEVELRMRIGIESGEVLVGDLGSSIRSTYTAVGDCINLASRLQEVGREIGEPLVIGPRTHAASRMALRPLGQTQIRGLDAPISVYGLPTVHDA